MTYPLPFSGAPRDAKEIITTSPNKKIDANEQTPVMTVHTTTVVYQKEPPQESPYVTYESLKKADSPSRNAIPADKTFISENDVKIFDKPPSKEVEMYSGIPNVLIKLNRTSRKELSMTQENRVTTAAATLELVQEPKSDEVLIDPKIEDLNANFSENNESEIFIITPTKTVAPERLQSENDSIKLFTKPALEEQKASSTEEPLLEPIPQPHPKPNRKRQLTRPQSRSFYPYFFSRVLG